ncbi:STS14 protein [Diospyros lotus]|uniref:STS14 protein n=1 Tax=Diospyros lotus TaxID=55363 RepID=UPI0022510D36|nr:STS14 protein [Diospyros lotus]
MAEALLLAAVVALAICQPNTARGAALPTATTPPPAPPSASQEFLDPHNQARAAVGVAPLKWSDMLANATSRLVRYQRDKKGCQFAELSSGKYGGNQLWSSGMPVPPRAAVETWVAEKQYYNYTDNSCEPNRKCGVYTQVVWSKSLELGCAQASCAKDQSTLTICFYNPPGNVIGERPY